MSFQRQPVRQAAVDFGELTIDGRVDGAIGAAKDKRSGCAGRVGFDANFGRAGRGQRGADGLGEPRMNGELPRFRRA